MPNILSGRGGFQDGKETSIMTNWTLNGRLSLYMKIKSRQSKKNSRGTKCREIRKIDALRGGSVWYFTWLNQSFRRKGKVRLKLQ